MVEKLLNNNFKFINLKNNRWKPIAILNSFWLNKFINILIIRGKKIKAQKIIFNLFFLLKQTFFFNPIFIFFNALDILRPTLELSSIKIGKRKYSIPIPVIFFRQYLIVLRWFKKNFQKAKSTKSFSAKLFTEINFLILKKNQSELWKIKSSLYQKALANRAYAHYRWK